MRRREKAKPVGFEPEPKFRRSDYYDPTELPPDGSHWWSCSPGMDQGDVIACYRLMRAHKRVREARDEWRREHGRDEWGRVGAHGEQW